MKIVIKQPNKPDIEFDLPEGSYIEVLKNEEILVQKELFDVHDIFTVFSSTENRKAFVFSRKPETVDLRHLFYKVMREHTELSLKEIGKIVDQDRTTVMHGLSAIESKLAVTPGLRKTYKEVLSKLRGE